jgi:CheY-like chemotaxis protein
MVTGWGQLPAGCLPEDDLQTGFRNDVVRQGATRSFAGRVLLVDDVREDVEVLAELLEPLQASIAGAESVEGALAMVDEQVVDLVVTDLNLPGASGLDLARDLRGRLDAPAVIVMTGSDRAEDRVTAFQLGAVAYLKKPIDVEQLIGLAREILRSRSAEPTAVPAAEKANAPSGAR